MNDTVNQPQEKPSIQPQEKPTLGPQPCACQPASGPSCTALVEQTIRGAFGEAFISDLLSERRTERRWKLVKRLGLTFFFLVSTLMGLLFYATEIGYKIMPKDDVVGVVRIDGVIMDDSMAGANKVIPALVKAFESPNVKSIILAIDSPGGSPLESERINKVIDTYRADPKYKKPIISVIGTVGASAAYMIAIHTDKIVAGNYSLIGSIGAIIDSWDFHKALDKIEVKRRMFASGKHKGMLSPYVAMNEESSRKAQSIVDGMAKTFADDVKNQRKGKLKDSVDYFTGEVWDGHDGLEIGLIDEIGTIDDYVKRNYPTLKPFEVGPLKKGGLPFMSADDIADGIKAVLARL